MPLDGTALIQKAAGILADEEEREQGPAGQIREPTNWPQSQKEPFPTRYGDIRSLGVQA